MVEQRSFIARKGKGHCLLQTTYHTKEAVDQGMRSLAMITASGNLAEEVGDGGMDIEEDDLEIELRETDRRPAGTRSGLRWAAVAQGKLKAF